MTKKSSAKNDFATALHLSSAVHLVLNAIEEGHEYDLPEALLKTAVKGGLAGHFSFMINDSRGDGCYADNEAVFAVIFPKKGDATSKCPNIIRAMLPGVDDTDECCETEWRFHTVMKDPTPAKIAVYLVDHGFSWDQGGDRCPKKSLKEIKDALSGKNIKPNAPKI